MSLKRPRLCSASRDVAEAVPPLSDDTNILRNFSSCSFLSSSPPPLRSPPPPAAVPAAPDIKITGCRTGAGERGAKAWMPAQRKAESIVNAPTTFPAPSQKTMNHDSQESYFTGKVYATTDNAETDLHKPSLSTLTSREPASPLRATPYPQCGGQAKLGQGGRRVTLQ